MHGQVTAGLVSQGPAPRRRRRRDHFVYEWRILRSDGLRRYISARRAVARFHRSVDRMVEAEGGGHDH